jgi:HEAT repeat protein
MPPLADWLWWLAGGLLLTAGLALALWALAWDRLRRKHRPARRCPRCWYDMTGTPGRRCPECGREAPSERKLAKSRRRWGWASVAAVAMAAGIGTGVWPLVEDDEWLPLVPTPVLWRMALADQSPGSAAHSELVYRRAAMDRLSPGARRRLATRAIQALADSGSVDERTMAASILGFIGGRDERTTPALLRALGDPAPRVRVQAVRMMGVYFADARRAVPALISVMEDPSEEPEVRTEAAAVLGNYGPFSPGAAAPLLSIAADEREDDEVRAAALRSLRRQRPPEEQALPVLLDALGHGNPEIALAAANAVGAYGPYAAPATEPLVALLDRVDPWEHAVILRTLGEIGPAASAASPRLKSLVADAETQAYTRLLAELSLATIAGDWPDLESAWIHTLLNDPDVGTRQMIAREIRRLRTTDPRFVDALIAAMDDPDQGVAITARTAVGMLGPFGRPGLDKLRELARHPAPGAGVMADYAINLIERSESEPRDPDQSGPD